MHTGSTRRAAALAAAVVFLGSCTSTQPGGAIRATTGASGKVETNDCPRVSLREGTGELTRQKEDAVEYVASIAGAGGACALEAGKLTMRVEVSGRLTPGLASGSTRATLPIRVAVVAGGKVLYSRLGRQTVPIEAGGDSVAFSYVDDSVVIPAPAPRDIVVYAGFDEGPPAG